MNACTAWACCGVAVLPVPDRPHRLVGKHRIDQRADAARIEHGRELAPDHDFGDAAISAPAGFPPRTGSESVPLPAPPGTWPLPACRSRRTALAARSGQPGHGGSQIRAASRPTLRRYTHLAAIRLRFARPSYGSAGQGRFNLRQVGIRHAHRVLHAGRSLQAGLENFEQAPIRRQAACIFQLPATTRLRIALIPQSCR